MDKVEVRRCEGITDAALTHGRGSETRSKHDAAFLHTILSEGTLTQNPDLT
jgi:hypothetical protein